MEEDYFGDIDDFDENMGGWFSDSDYTIANQCIAIYTEERYIGTGFLIDSSGVFVSVGHNFKDTTKKYSAY